MKIEIGMPVYSRAGHDEGKLYLIIGADEQYVYVSDGDIRPIDRPKRKKRKHIAKATQVPEAIQEKLIKGEALRNEDIKRVIKLWRAENV